MIKRSYDDLICDAYYQLVHQGLEHELSSRRMSFPRNFTLYKDSEDSKDQIMEAKLRQSLQANFERYFNGKITFENYQAVSSKGNLFMQLSDLFIGSINRVLNKDDAQKRNHKDELAEYILDLLQLPVSRAENVKNDFAFLEILGTQEATFSRTYQ